MKHLILSSSAMPGEMKIESKDISHGDFMGKNHEANIFGGEGGNISPHLAWSEAPKATQGFAIFAYDPDAPTGSGFWHWQLVNIPKHINSVPTDAGRSDSTLIPSRSTQVTNDYGLVGFGGACPPNGRTHRYQFTVYALSQKLEIPDGASSAVVGFMVNAHSLASVTLEALYKR